MNKYIKINENGEIIRPSNPMWIGSTMIANPRVEHLIQYGFKPILEVEKPEEQEGFNIIITGYNESEDGYTPIYDYEEIVNEDSDSLDI